MHAPAWYAVKVGHQFELSVSSHLKNHGYPVLLPLCRTQRKWSDRTKTISTPLFPGYVFSQFDADNRRPVDSFPGVRGIVSFGRTLAPIDPAELSAIRSVLDAGMMAQPWPFLEVGRKVIIDRGRLAGLVGVVVREKNSFRLVLSVTLLSRSLAFEIDRDWLRPIDD